MNSSQLVSDLREIQAMYPWKYLDEELGSKNPKDVNYWLAVNSPNYWGDFMYNGSFGLEERYLDLWLDVRPRDVVFFYATKPVKGVFGMGVVQQTCYRDELVYAEHGKDDDNDVLKNPCAGDLGMLIELDFFSGWDNREWLENSLPLQDLKIPVNRRFRRLTLLEAYPLIQEAFLE